MRVEARLAPCGDKASDQGSLLKAAMSPVRHARLGSIKF
jgi:hypothetical protein